MTTYCVSIGEREYQVKISGSKMSVNGEPIEADLISLNGQGLHLFQRGDQSVEVYLSTLGQGVYDVLIGGRRITTRVSSGTRRASARAGKVNAGDLTAPMPGLVVSVATAVGDVVEEGQPLLVVESMKMQMQMKAPISGKVALVPAVSGAQVEKGALLVRIVPE